MTINCYKCHQEILDLEKNGYISKNEECPHCKTSLKCCKMCVFYDKNSYNECREPVAERIVDKEKANFCDYFQLGSDTNNEQKKEELLNAANKLFNF